MARRSKASRRVAAAAPPPVPRRERSSAPSPPSHYRGRVSKVRPSRRRKRGRRSGHEAKEHAPAAPAAIDDHTVEEIYDEIELLDETSSESTVILAPRRRQPSGVTAREYAWRNRLETYLNEQLLLEAEAQAGIDTTNPSTTALMRTTTTQLTWPPTLPPPTSASRSQTAIYRQPMVDGRLGTRQELIDEARRLTPAEMQTLMDLDKEYGPGSDLSRPQACAVSLSQLVAAHEATKREIAMRFGGGSRSGDGGGIGGGTRAVRAKKRCVERWAPYPSRDEGWWVLPARVDPYEDTLRRVRLWMEMMAVNDDDDNGDKNREDGWDDD